VGAGPVSARVLVAGLGPAGPDLVTEATRAAIAEHPHRYLRTERHPAASLAGTATSFDRLYEHADALEQVYEGIVEELVAAARLHGTVLYLVPGSPAVAERTVELLRADGRVLVEVLAALSFLDLAWARLGVDPVATGVRVVDGHRFAVEAAGERGPLLVAQCDSPGVLSDVKLALDEVPGAPLGGHPVTVLARLGLPDESITTVPWAELDRVVAPDHLTTLWIPTLAAPVAAEVQRFAELVATLRQECPWDREQTHRSLTRHLLEETYEVLEAIGGLDEEAGEGYEHLEEELGDLLFQVVFHATLATEAGQFTLADVAGTVHDKLRLRHPHVFADVEVAGAGDVARNWEQIKKAEKGRDSVFEGIPAHLPALLYALKVQKKAAGLADAGLDVPVAPGLDDAVGAAREALAGPSDERGDAEVVGQLLLAAVDLARGRGVDPEAALRAAATRVRDVAGAVEAAAGAPETSASSTTE
jgi:tetrapyrrole methylase family protein/MazG family protein